MLGTDRPTSGSQCGRSLAAEGRAVIDHLGFEVTELARSAAFYDAVFFALGGRRVHEGAARDRLRRRTRPTFWIVARGRLPAAGYGHVALARARARGGRRRPPRRRCDTAGRDDGAPGLRERNTGRCTTPRTCAIPTACGSRSSAGSG